MDNFKTIEFKQNELFIRLIVANIFLAFFVSLVHFLKINIALGLGWFFIGSIWVLNYYLRISRPFCKITEDEIIVPNPISRFTKRIIWRDIEKIEVIRNKLIFILSGNKNINIDLFGMNKDERPIFIETVNKILTEKKQK